MSSRLVETVDWLRDAVMRMMAATHKREVYCTCDFSWKGAYTVYLATGHFKGCPYYGK